jgi:two-component system response regulator HydG
LIRDRPDTYSWLALECYSVGIAEGRESLAVVDMYTYLSVNTGARTGTSYLLNPAGENRIGRGVECLVVLTDPLCSRVHAVVQRRDGRWHVRDAESRNGTFVNDQKIDEGVLDEGHRLRVGTTEFVFHQSSEPPTAGHDGLHLSQTFIRDTRYGMVDSSSLPMLALSESEQAQDLLLLYQLSIKLLGFTNSNEVLRIALELLKERCGASVVGFLWATEEGDLKPKMVIPERATGQVVLSESLTQHVISERHAVWIANQAGGTHDHLDSYADALCIPMVQDNNVIGALHVYLERGRFRQSHFDFAISLANITSIALVRSRRDESLKVDFARLKAKTGADELVGDSAPIVDLKTKISRLGRATGCVLIRGESGAGKELVARALHRASPRADRPMLSVNCAAIPADLMESQLFGHKAGSFTGADRDHIGFFQQADLGTLFLDEVGELTLAGQAKLLRILERHPFLPVGATTEVQVDVRVIAATNRDLLTYVRERKFREDLFYRLSVFELYVPPLRERGKDIGMLVEHFLEFFRDAHGRRNLGLSKAAREKLLGYSWPGNVRQLRNVIDSAVVLAAGDEIVPEDLGLRDVGDGELASLRLEDWERKLIAEALRRSDGSVPEAARLLGIGRATLYRKIEEYKIER